MENNLREFYKVLKRHDWFAEMSDDQDVWLEARQERMCFFNEAQSTEDKGALYEAFTTWQNHTMNNASLPVVPVEHFIPDSILEELENHDE